MKSLNFTGVIFLYLVKKMNGSRSVFGAYHILKGKKSAQTLQDCHLFYVSQLFGIDKDLNREVFLQVVEMLAEKNYIKDYNENCVSITETGEAYLNNQLDIHPLPVHLNGFAYKDITAIFSKRLVLITQSLSFLKKHKNYFVPIIKDVRTQRWVRDKLTSNTTSINGLARNLYNELDMILQQFTEQQSLLFILRLTGSHRVGLTMHQIADYFQIDSNYAKIQYIGVVHGILENIINDNQFYPTLYSFIKDKADTTLLTVTAQKTYSLLKNGLQIEKISEVRQLKQNTVEDHIVEIAMNVTDFSIDDFVIKEKQEMIAAVVQKLKTRKLKIIKEQLTENISFFEIRLTIARKGFGNGSK